MDWSYVIIAGVWCTYLMPIMLARYRQNPQVRAIKTLVFVGILPTILFGAWLFTFLAWAGAMVWVAVVQRPTNLLRSEGVAHGTHE